MDRIRDRVKRKRLYDATGRQAQAARNRDVMLDAAQRLFLSVGYTATTIASIAAAAGVSVETIYKGFGGKSGLVRAIRDRGLAGTGSTPAEERSNRLRSRTKDPQALIAHWGALTMEVAPKVSPILLLVRAAAATDAEMASLLAEMDADRLRRMTINARHLHAGGHLRTGVTLEDAVDTLWTYSSPELYELLVLRRGWTLERYGRFVAAAMVSALLRPARRRTPLVQRLPG